MMVKMEVSRIATEGIRNNLPTAVAKHEAVEKVIREHYKGVHRLARHLTRNNDDAADLAQATFIKACAHFDRFDGRSTMRAWLTGILYHEFLHWRRGRRFFSSLFDRDSFDPTNSILDRETLLQAIHQLPSKLRDTFLLIEVHGLSLAEASIALKVPVGTLKSRQSAARTKLRELITLENDHDV